MRTISVSLLSLLLALPLFCSAQQSNTTPAEHGMVENYKGPKAVKYYTPLPVHDLGSIATPQVRAEILTELLAEKLALTPQQTEAVLAAALDACLTIDQLAEIQNPDEAWLHKSLRTVHTHRKLKIQLVLDESQQTLLKSHHKDIWAQYEAKLGESWDHLTKAQDPNHPYKGKNNGKAKGKGANIPLDGQQAPSNGKSNPGAEDTK